MRKAKGPKNTANNKNFVTHLMTMPQAAGKKQLTTNFQLNRNYASFSEPTCLASVFIYGSFYFAFVPAPAHRAPLFLGFEPCENSPTKCGFMNASVHFNMLEVSEFSQIHFLRS